MLLRKCVLTEFRVFQNVSQYSVTPECEPECVSVCEKRDGEGVHTADGLPLTLSCSDNFKHIQFRFMTIFHILVQSYKFKMGITP